MMKRMSNIDRLLFNQVEQRGYIVFEKILSTRGASSVSFEDARDLLEAFVRLTENNLCTGRITEQGKIILKKTNGEQKK